MFQYYIVPLYDYIKSHVQGETGVLGTQESFLFLFFIFTSTTITRLHTKSLICQHHEVDATVFETPALVPQVP